MAKRQPVKPVGEPDHKQGNTKHAGGRPTIYSQELADKICAEISQTEMGFHKLYKALDWFPDPSTILDWVAKYPEFTKQYAQARRLQMDLMGERILDIVDDSSGDESISPNGNRIENREFTSRSKLRAEARMWLMERLAPKVYGKFIKDEDEGEKEQAKPPTININITPENIAKALSGDNA